jgi:hypothetical protein
VLALTMPSDAPRTCVTMLRSDSCIWVSVPIKPAASSAPQARGRVVRSPSRMASMWKATSFSPPCSTLSKEMNRYQASIRHKASRLNLRLRLKLKPFMRTARRPSSAGKALS